MLKTDELKSFIKTTCTTIKDKPIDNMQMAIYAFSQKYDENQNIFNYPSYKINVTADQIKSYAQNLLSKAASIINKSSEVKTFNYNNSKTAIDFIDLDNSPYSTKIDDCISKISNAGIVRFSDIKNMANCIAIHIKYDDQDIYLFAKGTPYVKTPKFIFMVDEDEELTTPISYNLKFPMSLSACILNKDVYLFGSLVESIFGFENSLKEQMNEAMEEISSANIFDDESFSLLKELSSKGKNYYCYNNFDKTKLDSLKNGNSYAKKFLEKYNIKKNSQGQLILDSEEKQKIMNKFLCNDLKRDYVNIDQVYDAPGNDIID